jgi:hypothetical protein
LTVIDEPFSKISIISVEFIIWRKISVSLLGELSETLKVIKLGFERFPKAIRCEKSA